MATKRFPVLKDDRSKLSAMTDSELTGTIALEEQLIVSAKQEKKDLQRKVSQMDDKIANHNSRIRMFKNEKQQRVERNFKESLFNHYPKVKKETLEKMYSKAYTDGHHSGLHAVESNFHELVELVL